MFVGHVSRIFGRGKKGGRIWKGTSAISVEAAMQNVISIQTRMGMVDAR